MMPELRATLRTLAWNVAELRHARNLTLEQAASRAEIATRHLGKLEAGDGNPTVRTLVKVAGALGADIRGLFKPIPRRP